jgi:acyl carrier protein
MTTPRDEIQTYLTTLLQELARDAAYTLDVDADTGLFSDLGFESLDAVVLGTAIQEHYKQVFPFVKLFAQVGQRPVPDMPVGEWVDFISEHMQDVPAAAARPAGGRA